MTRQRRVILDELRRRDSHPTVDEVYARVRRRLPHISMATVYRNLELMSQCGLIGEIDTCGARRYDGHPGQHYHVRCKVCGLLGDVPIRTAERLEAAGQKASEFEIVGHRLEFIGVCPACAARNDPATRRR